MTLFSPEELHQSTAPSGPSTRVRLLVAYDGLPFRGFARQPGVKTVAGVLGDAVQRVLGVPVDFTCAGRTDAGVHAWGQVVHFDVPNDPGLDLVALQRSLNRMLRPAIVVRQAEITPETFDARRSALARRYRYTVLNRPVPDPFLARTSWHVENALDTRSLELAADPLIGEHDFGAFCRRPADGASTVRRVVEARWSDCGDGVLRFEIEATSFCQQMVRSVVGTMVDIGLGRKRAGDMAWILRSADRQKAGNVAPPHGLCLWEVRY